MGKLLPRRTVGATGLELSELGLGAAPLGNLFRRVPESEVTLTIQAALDVGIRYVDTAPYYGAGLSERRVGDGVRGRADIVVSTKAGRLLRPIPARANEAERDGFHAPLPFEPVYDYTYDGIMRSWEMSLQRLGLARVDILLVHDIGTLVHGEANAAYFNQLTTGGGFRALEALRSTRAITAIGLGVNEWEVCLEAMQHVRLDVVLLAGRYTLLNHHSALAQFMPTCVRERIGVVVGGVYNSGILATGTRSSTVPYYDYAPAPDDIIAKVRRLESVCDAHGVPLAAAALQFSLAHPAVVSAILGLGSPQQVSLAMLAYGTPIPASFWAELSSSGLLADDAPIPKAQGEA